MELAVQFGGGIFPYPHIELFRFNYPLPLAGTPKLQLFGAQLEVKRLLAPGSESDPLKTLKLPHRARRTPSALMDVQLCNRVARTVSAVRNINRNI
jgi:hypothetical protein